MKLLFVLGSRGEWGYIRPIIAMAQARGHQVDIWCCNMSTLDRFGNLSRIIRDEGYPVAGEFYTAVEGDTNSALSKSFGLASLSASDWLMNHKYDWIVIAGDRLEQLSFVVVAAVNRFPICHIQAGERSGNIDGMSRHAIARFAHLHFAANEDAAVRLIRTGEEKKRVYVTGAPQLDDLELQQLPKLDELLERGVILKSEYILAVLHGVTEEETTNSKNAQVLIDFLTNQNLPIVWIGSNNDTNALDIQLKIKHSLRKNDRYFTNLNRLDYLALLSNCNLMIGNSSSGILEAPSFGKPVINVGRRQLDRVRGVNIIDCDFAYDKLTSALQRATSLEFKEISSKSINPYGDGQSSHRILNILEATEISHDFLNKQVTY